MLFISYTQNLKDAILWRALRHVDAGFYIDAGAWNPRDDSVPLAFYERGWTGLNVEPDPTMFANWRLLARVMSTCRRLTRIERPNRIFDIFKDMGWSTLDPSIARQHKNAGAPFKQHLVLATTLSDICDLHAPAEIHFLKIDVEGAEDAADWSEYQATAPLDSRRRGDEANFPEESHTAWEGILPGYRLAYLDGLTHSMSHAAELQPPNISRPTMVSDYKHDLLATIKTDRSIA